MTLAGRVVHAALLKPTRVLLLAGALSLLTLWGLFRIRADARLDSMFSERDPSARALSRVLDRFGTTDELIVLVTLPDNEAPAPAKLIDFAGRFVSAAQKSPDSGIARSILDRADPDGRKFVENELAPAGLYFLSDSGI